MVGVSLAVEPNEVFGLIGPNGAGKTALFNVITGVVRPSSGKVLVAGRDVTGKSPDVLARLGLARTFQNIRLFRDMNAVENVMIGCHTRTRAGLLSVLLATDRGERRRTFDRARSLLDRVGLPRAAPVMAGRLPYGQQRRLEIARALASEPKLLLLDEPSAGMNHDETDDLAALVMSLKADGLTIVLIEHNMQFMMQLSDRLMVLDFGRKIAEGTPPGGQSKPSRDRRIPWRAVSTTVLSVSGLYAGYGWINVLKGIDLELKEGEVRAILGPNGAGKSTLLKAIAGLIKPTKGRITMASRDRGVITDWKAHEGSALGLVLVPEGRGILATMAVRENLEMGAYGVRDRREVNRRLDEVFARLPLLGLRASQVAGTLSGGEQQMLAIGRALMARPRILLLDEPALGLAPLTIASVYALIAAIHREGAAILIVEQNVKRGLSLASWAYVLDNGEVAVEGAPDALQDSPAIRRAYLGMTETRPDA